MGEMRRAVDLGEMKKENGLKGFGLFLQPRLSMVPVLVLEEVWKRVHGSKSRYRSPTRTVLRRNGRGVSVAYRPIRKIMIKIFKNY